MRIALLGLSRLLDRVGVAQIEAGTPAMGELEQEAIKAIVRENLKARVTAWNRIVLEDLRASVACGVREVHISAPASSILVRDKLRQSFRWVLDRLRQACRFARERVSD